MKRLFIFLFLFTFSILVAWGCISKNPNPPKSSNLVLENGLRVYNWSTYIDPDVIEEFEKKFGVKIQYDTYASDDQLYATLKERNPGYDVIFPSDYLVSVMAKNKLLEPINLNNISNFKNIDSKFIKLPFDPENKYTVPYQWGTMGIGYNIKSIGGEIDSWSVIFDSKYKNRVALIDEMRTMLGAVLIYLGYDPNTTNYDDIIQARDYLIKHQETIAKFAPDTGQVLLDRGQIDIAVEWSGDIFQVMKTNPNIRYTIPKEGTIIWIDNIAIPENAPHKELAEKFINFILEPEISAKISNYIKFGTTNKQAIEMGLINPEDLENLAIYPPIAVFKKLTYIKDVGSATRLYEKAWNEVKANIKR